MSTSTTKQTELGEELQCIRCQEFWPADTEFFYARGGQLYHLCKACYLTKRYADNAARAAAAAAA